MNFDVVTEFENKVANFFGSPYAIAVDCCTHGLELCLRYEKCDDIEIPCRTYISVPFLAEKLKLKWKWKEEEWKDFYYLGNTNIIDAAVLWKKNSYIPNTYMCLSFQFQKHLSLGRGGMILLDNKDSYDVLKKMSYDGRIHGVPWREQNISVVGYHYYMTPEIAQLGLDKFENSIQTQPRQWVITDWPNLRNMEVFK
jgi:dTDP-4-amino-4,6-dideoxygalactose transaminase